MERRDAETPRKTRSKPQSASTRRFLRHGGSSTRRPATAGLRLGVSAFIFALFVDRYCFADSSASDFTAADPLWHAAFFSLQIAAAATILAAVIAVPLAWAMARRKSLAKSVLEAILIVPLVLPPTVVGYGLIVLLGRRGWIGSMIARHLNGYTILFRPEGAVIAALVVALPLLYLPAKAAFVSVDRELEDVARLLGAGRWRTFWQISLPLARRQIAAGLLLAFARALGEFGATLMVLGDLSGRRTLPIVIYDATAGADYGQAIPAVLTLSAVSLIVVLIFNRLPLSRQD